ncbi:MAG: hypothetical protein LBT98_02465 [Puniceicoccales bacterium]|jgi:hypothetical protein|nr:hypothetical protein [Puniceicoccales bacterium]
MNMNVVNGNAGPNRLQRLINDARLALRPPCTFKSGLIGLASVVLVGGTGALAHWTAMAMGFPGIACGAIASLAGGMLSSLPLTYLFHRHMGQERPPAEQPDARAAEEELDNWAVAGQNPRNDQRERPGPANFRQRAMSVDEALEIFERGKAAGKLEYQNEMPPNNPPVCIDNALQNTMPMSYANPTQFFFFTSPSPDPIPTIGINPLEEPFTLEIDPDCKIGSNPAIRYFFNDINLNSTEASDISPLLNHNSVFTDQVTVPETLAFYQLPI